jgi:hypothetical protein
MLRRATVLNWRKVVAFDWIDEVVRKIAAQFYFHFLDPGPIEKVRCQGPPCGGRSPLHPPFSIVRRLTS